MSLFHKVLTQTVDIKKPEGIYTLLYGVHILSQNPEDIPDDADAVVLETGIVPYLDDPDKAFGHLKDHIQYRTLIKYLEKKRIPIIFNDIKYKYNDMALLLLDNSMSVWKWSQGMKLLSRTAGARKPVRLFRYLTAGWLLFPFFANAIRLASVFTGVGLKYSAQLKKLAHRLHPDSDLLFLTIRNALIAEKNEYYMKHFGINKHIVTVIGAGHVGIEDMIEMDNDKRMSRIKKLMPLIKRLVDPEYFYKAVRYVYNGDKWQVAGTIESVHLKQLVS